MTKFTETSTTKCIETAIMAGDPILTDVSGQIKIAKLTLVKKANRKVKFISCEDLNSPNVEVEANYKVMDCIDDSYVWDGSLGESVSANGTKIYNIKPILKTINDKLILHLKNNSYYICMFN